jgi:hypothetical protein
LTLELGALIRSSDHTEDDYDILVKRDTTTYAGRALIGWTWRIGYYGFIAVAVGASAGFERGEESSQRILEENVTKSVAAGAGEGEAYLRLGFAYGG